MTQKEIDKKAWEVLENLLKDVPNMELVPSKRTKNELLDEDKHTESEVKK